MSRSKHTTPPAIRAAHRVRAPYAPRDQGEHRREHGLARVLKEQGIIVESGETPRIGECVMRWPRLHAQRARAGHMFAITLTDVRSILAYFGPYTFYGLQAVELVQGEEARPGTSLHLGRLVVPGRIVLYDHLPPPWMLPGRLAPQAQEQLRRAGAVVEPLGQGSHTAVAWPGTSLRDFILFDVLMHEVGHHVVQQYTGKYQARVMRTRDHEAVADGFAAYCRRLYRAEEHAR